MKKGNTIRFSLEEIRERRRRGISGIDWKKVNAMTDEDIERLALEDNRRHGIRDDWYKGAVRVNGIDELVALHRREQAERCKSGDKKK